MTGSLLCTVMLCAFTATAQGGSILYVDDDAPPSGDGTSWNAAFRYLQDALAVADVGDEIRVAQGIYRPDQSEYGNADLFDRDVSFELFDGLQLLGGFDGVTGSDPDERDIEQYRTTLSGDLQQNDEADFVNISDNSYSVVSAVDTDAAVLLEGFTIRAGNADGHGFEHRQRGGGIYIDDAPIQIQYCTLKDNVADWGGGIHVWNGAAPSIAHCNLVHNRASSDDGGAIFCLDVSTFALSDCDFWKNSAPSGVAGGLAVLSVNECTLIRCSFSENTGERAGGARLGYGYGPPLESVHLSECRFINNTGVFHMGGLGIASSMATLTSCRFIGNCSPSIAAVSVYVEELVDDFQVRFVDCVFANNEADSVGAGIASGGRVLVANCVLVNNHASLDCASICVAHDSIVVNTTVLNNGGAGIKVLGSKDDVVTIANSIVRDNNVNVDLGSHGVVDVSHSNIEGGWPGIGNIDAPPIFVQPGTLNYRLAHGSPGIDAGSNAALPADELDLDNDGDTSEPLPIDLGGAARIQNGVVDMGAYEGEFDALPPGAQNDDIDPGEEIWVMPTGEHPILPDSLAVLVRNTSEVANATVTVTDLRDSARGANDGAQLRIETDLGPGEVEFEVKLPFENVGSPSASPLTYNLTRLDDSTGEWVLAPATNVAINPQFNEPIGQRYVADGGSFLIPSDAFGDYGVYWNASNEAGFVWANTDRAGDFSLRVGECPADSMPYGGNQRIDLFDLLELLRRWGTDDRWADADSNNMVDIDDVAILLDAWGICGD